VDLTADRRDAELVEALDRERPGLQGAAYLLTGDPPSADELLDAVLADLLIRRTPAADLRREALRALVGEQRPTALPGAGGPAVELLDGSRDAGRPRAVAELARLPLADRAAVVLRHYSGLNAAEIANLLGRTPADAAALADRATAELQRGGDDGWTAVLSAAIPYDRSTSLGSQRDVANARRLLGHRRRRRVGLGVAAALVLLLLVTQLRTSPAPIELTSPVPTPADTVTQRPEEPPCDTSDRNCQGRLLRAWQTTMADVIGSYVDPGDHYFTGYRAAAGTLNRPGFWVSKDGALAIDLVPRDRGSTQVSVQIATGRPYATRCGSTTRMECISMRFMDGNRFTLTETSRVEEGIEVQYSPEGTQVVTAIARNTTRGEPLTIDRGQLVQLVQDPRLRLPVR